MFPLAIGGSLITERVCEPCNSILGSRVDAALCDFLPIRNRRAELGLAGNSGRPPPLYEMLTGNGELVDQPGQLIRSTFNKRTGKFDIRALHHAADVTLPNGQKVRQITMDLRDIDQLPKVINRERKRHSLPPLTPAQIAEEIEKARATSSTVDNPTVRMNVRTKFAYLRHALMKIAYELAFLWLGESYLEDPTAVKLRQAVIDPDRESTDKIPGFVGDAQDCPTFTYWSDEVNSHIALAQTANGIISIAVRIFDIHAGLIKVTENASSYLTGPNVHNKLRFLRIDPLTRKLEDVPLIEETGRIAQAVIARLSGLP